MFQFKGDFIIAQKNMEKNKIFPPAWKDMAQLEKEANSWLAQLLIERSVVAEKRGGLFRIHESVDQRLRTDKPEYMDDPDFPADSKLTIVKRLHFFNLLVFSYRRYIYLLTPLILEAQARTGRRAKLLELASGYGELAMEFGRLAAKKKLPLAVTGSDYIPEYVDAAKKRAIRRNFPVDFRQVNAFEMHDFDSGEFDIILISQATHHFSPGQLAVIIAQSQRTASTAFVSFDGRRSLLHLLTLPLAPSFLGKKAGMHDAWLSSRKFYSEFELATMAKIAAPDAKVDVRPSHPGVSMLTVRFNS